MCLWRSLVYFGECGRVVKAGKVAICLRKVLDLVVGVEGSG